MFIYLSSYASYLSNCLSVCLCKCVSLLTEGVIPLQPLPTFDGPSWFIATLKGCCRRLHFYFMFPLPCMKRRCDLLVRQILQRTVFWCVCVCVCVEGGRIGGGSVRLQSVLLAFQWLDFKSRIILFLGSSLPFKWEKKIKWFHWFKKNAWVSKTEFIKTCFLMQPDTLGELRGSWILTWIHNNESCCVCSGSPVRKKKTTNPLQRIKGLTDFDNCVRIKLYSCAKTHACKWSLSELTVRCSDGS